MSQENVEAVERFVDAYNRRDVDAMLAELDPEVEWHSAILEPVGGRARVYRGHEGFREVFGDLYDALAEFHIEYSEIAGPWRSNRGNRPRAYARQGQWS